jgi:hypothetical protein
MYWTLKMIKTLETRTLITSFGEFENMYPVIKVTVVPSSTGKEGFKKQDVTYIELKKRSAVMHTNVVFRARHLMCNGPILPYSDVKDGKEYGVKRPQIKVSVDPSSDNFKLLYELDIRFRAAYMFHDSGIGAAFPNIITFVPIEAVAKPGKFAKAGTPPEKVYRVGVILSDKPTEIIPFEALLHDLTEEQSEAYTQMMRKDSNVIAEKVCFIPAEDGLETEEPVHVFPQLKSRVHEKSGRLYVEMNIHHQRFPGNNPDGSDEVRKYLQVNDPRPGIGSLDQWGIVIPHLVRVDTVNEYAVRKGSNWAAEKTCKPVLGPKDKNYFIATINFYPEQVMQVKSSFKTWWRAENVSKQPEESKSFSIVDPEEDEIDENGNISGPLKLLMQAPSARPAVASSPAGPIAGTAFREEKVD